VTGTPAGASRKLRALALSLVVVLSVLSSVTLAGVAAAANDSVTIHESAQGADITGTDVADSTTVYVKITDGTTTGGTKSVTVSNDNGNSFSITVSDDGNTLDGTASDGDYWGAFSVTSGSSNTDSATNTLGVDEGNQATVTGDLDGNSDSGSASVTTDYTSPSISSVNLGELSGDMTITFDSDEQLGSDTTDLSVRVTGPNGKIYLFDKADFSESGSGPYTYTLSTTQAYDDGSGSYSVSIVDAKDSAGNNGGNDGDGSGLSDSYSYSGGGDTTSPTVSNVQLTESSGNLAFTFDSDEQLGGNAGDLQVTVDSPNTGTDWKTFDRNDFSETQNRDGSYTYTLTTTQAYDDGSGSYTATVDDAKDSAGNNGGVNGDGSWLSDGYDTSDTTAPSISGVSISESSGIMAISFDSDEQLGTGSGAIQVSVSGPNGASYSFDRSQFTESVSGGTYTYTLLTGQSFNDGDGTYTVSVDDAKDGNGNNGGTNGAGSGLTDTYSYSDTTAPSISSVTLDKSGDRIKVSFVSDEKLGTDPTDIKVSIDEPDGTTDWKTFYRGDFSVVPLQNGDYKYTLDQNGFDSGEGTYTLTVDDAKDSSGNNGGVNGQGSSLTDTYNFNPQGTTPEIVSKDVKYIGGSAKFQNDAEVEKNIHWNTQLTSQSFEFRLWVAGDQLDAGDQKRNLSLSPVGFDESTEIKVTFTVKNYDPSVLMGSANVSSWQVNDKSGSKKEIVVTMHPAVVQRNFNAPFAPSQWDSSNQNYKKSWEQAEVGFDALVTLQMFKFSQNSGLSKLDGARLNTDAQAFTTPSAKNGKLVFNVAAPHCKVGAKSDPNDPAADDKCNSQYVNSDGFYKAVIPKAFWKDQWGSDLDPNNMSLVYQSGGSSETLTNVNITKRNNGDLYIEAKGIHYSSGDIETVEDTTDPTADAGSDQSVTVGGTVDFDGTSSSDGETSVTTYKWDVDGDGTYEKTGSKPSHTYSSPGTYTVTLKVEDGGSNTATDTMTVTVTDATAPTADAGSDATVAVGDSVTLDASSSSDNVGVSTYEWDVDDDGTYEKTGASIGHTYLSTGSRTVTLRVTDGAGNTDTDTVTVTVESASGSGSSEESETDPVEVTHDASKNRTDIHVREPGENVSVDLDSDGSSATGVSATRLSFDADTDESFTMNVSTHDAVPDGTPEPSASDVGGDALGYFRIDHSVGDEKLSDLTIRVTVSWDKLTNGTDEHDLVLYRYHDGEWQAVETSVVGYTGQGAILEARPPGLSVFAVGAERTADVGVAATQLETTAVTTGEPVTVTATVENAGTASGTGTVEVAVDGTVRDTETVTLAPGESTTVEFTVSLDAAGTYDLAVDGTGVGSVTVEAASTPTPTETATPAPTATPTAAPTPTPAPTATPTAAPTSTQTPEPVETGAGGPGFGPAVALLALVLAALAVGRRR